MYYNVIKIVSETGILVCNNDDKEMQKGTRNCTVFATNWK